MKPVFLLNFFLLFLSILTIIKGLFVKKIYAQYFIINNHETLIDPRSDPYSPKLKIEKSLNFVRSHNLKLSIISYLKFKNLVFINCLEYFSNKLNLKNVFLLEFILRVYRIKKFTTIDDYRYLNIFIPTCKKLHIHTIGYMHGRFSKNIKSQSFLFTHTFDKYFVWSNYFKIKILSINSKYKKKNIEIFNKFKKLKIKKSNLKSKNIIFLQEKNTPNIFFFKLSEEFRKSKKYIISYKPRQNQILDERILKFCKRNNIKIYDNIPFEDLINKKKFHAVIGANSTALLSASYFDVFPISIKSKHSLKEFFDEKIVFPLDLKKKILPQIKHIISNKTKLKKIQKKVWK